MWECVFVPDVSNLWSVLEEPAIGNLVLPADVTGILPQETYLVGGVSCVPQRVPQILTRTCLRFYHLVVKSIHTVSVRGEGGCQQVMTADTLSQFTPWVVFQVQPRLWRELPASRFVLSASTSLRRKRRSPGSQKWSQRSRHLSPCSRGRFLQSPLHWRLCNLQIHDNSLKISMGNNV